MEGSLPGGTRLGRYEVVSLLAAGGMGEVYVARDTNLGRQVALKILPPELTADSERVARFVREAQASSALNHPAIVTVYDAGTDGGVQYLAMELIDGEPLSEWMRKHRDTGRAIDLMAQVADGLAAAHAHGIVHRDLKPANIVVGRGGFAKVVDFGVAKLSERLNGKPASGDTAPAAVIGTAAYMAPEQIEGRAVDHRADVYSFGVVLHELLTGRHPIDHVAHRTPPLEGLPRDLQRILRRCLNKDPELRYQSMKDVALDLREASLGAEIAHKPRTLVWAAILAAAVAVSLFVIFGRLGAPKAAPPAAPGRQTQMTRLTNSGRVVAAAISPDGKYLVHAAYEADEQSLWVKQVATGTLTQIAARAPVYYHNLAVSRDGDYVYYVSSTRAEPNVGDLYQMPLLGGTPRRVASDIEFTFSLSPDGTRVVFRRFNAFDREHRVTIAGIDSGEEEIIVRRGYPAFADRPAWSPDGNVISFIGGDWRSPKIEHFDLRTRAIKRQPTPNWPALGPISWMPDGSGLLVTVYDRESPPQIWFLAPDGEARKITSDLDAYVSVSATADASTLAAVRDETDSNIWTLDLERTARPGNAALRPVTTGLGNYFGGNGVGWLSDREVFYTVVMEKMPTYVAMPADGSGLPRRVIHGIAVWSPVVSPDGSRIAFVSDKSGSPEIWISDASGGNARQLTRVGRAGIPSFMPDGRSIVFVSGGQKQVAWRIGVDGGAPQQITFTPTSGALVSPDGRWLLCRLRASDRKGPLWRTAVLPLDASGPPRFFSVPAYGGPIRLQWHPSGRSFTFLDSKEGLMNIWLQDIDGGPPRQVTFFDSGLIFNFAWSHDGRKLVLSRGEPRSDAVLIRNFR